ncbi:MAG: IS66 family insertion sequence element accessory protein TnpB [Candidatus Planktophila sp.]
MIWTANRGRIFVFGAAVDMRKGVNGLCGLVREMNINPLSGDIFVFLSRDRSRIRLLKWEGDGFGIYSKWLEVGTFERPICDGNLLSEDGLYMLLRGIGLANIRYRKRYQHSVANCG